MNIRTLLLSLFALFTVLAANSQVSIGRSHIGRFRDFKPEQYKIIKGRKTIFIVAPDDYDDFSKMIKSAWNVNEYEVVRQDTFNANTRKYITEKNAIFTLATTVTTITSVNSKTGQHGVSSDYIHIYLYYYYPTNVQEKEGRITYNKNEVAAIYLSPDAKTMWGVLGQAKSDDAIKDGGTQYEASNYKLGYLKNYYQYVSTTLEKGGYSFAYDNNWDLDKIKKLRKATLYVPEYIKMEYNGWTGQEKVAKNPEKLIKDYRFKAQFISDEELNDKILEGGKDDFYYLSYVKVNSQKMITVTNGRTGDIIYKYYKTMSYKLKPKDITRIGKKANRG